MHLFSRDQQALLWTLSEPADPAGKGHCNYLKPDPTPPIVTHWQNIEIHSCMFLASHLFTVTASFCSHPSLFHISPHLFLLFSKKRLNLPIQKDIRINGYYIYTIDGSYYDCQYFIGNYHYGSKP